MRKLVAPATIATLVALAIAVNGDADAQPAEPGPPTKEVISSSPLTPEQLARDTFGLSTDIAVIDQRTSSASIERFGMRLSPAEHQHVEQWLAFEETVVEDIAPKLEQLDQYHGLYFDRGNDISLVVVAAPGGVGNVAKDGALEPLGERVTVVTRDYTYEQAQTWVRTITEAWNRDNRLPAMNSVSLSTDWTRLEISTPEPVTAEQAAVVESLAADLPGTPNIDWTVDPPDQDNACTSRTNCTWPMRAGIKITACTMGFHVRVGSDEQFLTSGHCQGGGTDTYSHPGWGIVGTTTSNFLLQGYDVQRVQMSDGQASNRIYGWSSAQNITGHRYPTPGETICSSLGARNDTRCGYVASTSTSWTSTTCNCTVYGADHNNIPSGGGDSGSPLFRNGSAIGVHATTWGRFALVSDAMWLWGINVVT